VVSSEVFMHILRRLIMLIVMCPIIRSNLSTWHLPFFYIPVPFDTGVVVSNVTIPTCRMYSSHKNCLFVITEININV